LDYQLLLLIYLFLGFNSTMKYGVCQLGIVSVRADKQDQSEIVTQLLYGDKYTVLLSQKNWTKIRIDADRYEGWISNNQHFEIQKPQWEELSQQDATYATDLISYCHQDNGLLFPIPLGSNLNVQQLLSHQHEGNRCSQKQNREAILKTAYLYLNAPYLWGGKSPFGIDCSGFSQMVYRINGYSLFRDASQQAEQGQTLSFIEESQAGDLAFFDDAEGNIIHVGILLPNHKIIHAHGKVRIDGIDQTGIYNKELQNHSHKLRMIKTIV